MTNPGLETAITRVVYYAENKKNGSTNTGCIPVIEESPDREEYYDSKVYYGGNCYVQWGQGAPYNKYCPMIDGDHTVTGCVATAIAQLMSIYEYPCNYGSYDFSWNDINSEITPPEGVPEDQVAHLMEQLGLPQNLDMEYGVNGSGASPNRIPKTLENFGYSDGGNLIEYDTEEVVSELKAGYPVLIGGASIRTTTTFLGIPFRSYSQAHRWLAHGVLELSRTTKYYEDFEYVASSVDTTWYILCNFGWNGNADGYYLSGIFDTTVAPDYNWNVPTKSETEGVPGNYQYEMTAVVGIRK